jgi:hypothetical protein
MTPSAHITARSSAAPVTPTKGVRVVILASVAPVAVALTAANDGFMSAT